MVLDFNIKSLVPKVLTALLPIALWYIGLWDTADTPVWPFGEFRFLTVLYEENLFPHKVKVGLVFVVVNIIVYLFLLFVRARNNQKKFYRGILGHILSYKLKEDASAPSKNRITFYKKVYGFVFLPKYIYSSFRNIFKHHERHLILYSLKNVPLPWRKYLVIFSRKGNPYENGTSTYFKLAEHEKDVDGIVSYVAFHSVHYSVTLPDLREEIIGEHKKVDSLPAPLKNKVRKYMSDGKIKNFDRLKSIHRHSMHIWAMPIFDKEQELWGVVAFDSNNDDSPFKDDDAKNYLIAQCKLLGTLAVELPA